MLLMATYIDKTTITAHPSSLNTKNTITYDFGNPGPGFGQAQKCGRVKPTVNTYSILLHC